MANGNYAIASGYNSIAIGLGVLASGSVSVASGAYTIARGVNSTASGDYTRAESRSEFVIGSYNTDYTPLGSQNWNAADRLFVVGNGENSSNRSNALTILKNGKTTNQCTSR